MALKENYKDDILDVSVNTKRKYRMTENADGTISLDDETVYTQEGDSFGASDMNSTNGKVNEHENDLTLYDVDNEEYTTDKFRFAKKGDEFGYLDENDNFVAFGGGETMVYIGNYTGNQTIDVTQYIKSGDTVENFVIEYLGCNAADTGTASSSSSTRWRAYASAFTPSKSLSGNSLSIVMSSGITLYKGSSDPASNYAAGATINHKYNLYYKK